jgi:hypothetical protein
VIAEVREYGISVLFRCIDHGANPKLRIQWGFVWIINASEVLDFSSSGFDIHSFCIAPLAFVKWCVNKYLDKVISADHVSDFVSRGSVRTHGRADNRAVMSDNLARDEPNPADVQIPIVFAEAEALR